MAKRPKDHFYKLAKSEGYVARSAYKLEAIDQKYKIFKKQKIGTLIDFGASPGSWYQYYQQKINPEVTVIALDLKAFKTQVKKGHFLKQDISILNTDDLKPYIQGSVHWILSDALPNMTGNRLQDRAQANALRDHIAKIGLSLLAPGGSVVIKVFETPALQPWFKLMKIKFKNARLEKPEASRKQSPEMFFVGVQYLA
jgi:23S rRNA (uridine2552-2'-O)-methyltransferase